MYKLSAETSLSNEMILKYIELDRNTASHYRKLYNYYIGEHDIRKRQMADASKPNNKIVNPYAHYISDIMCGYFMGEPVQYSSAEEQQLNEIKAIYNYNDEAAENAELAQSASIYGVAYELMYLDADSQIRFKKIDTEGCIPIFENDVESDLLYFIRYYDEQDILTGITKTYVEVYTRSEIITYEKTESTLTVLDTQNHVWGLVPINIFDNNTYKLGDFETVISEIDAYDKMESDSLNEMEYFNDAYLALYGLEGTEAEDISGMKEARVLLMPQDGKAEWLVKSVNDTYIENQKSRIDANIHKFSYCPAMTDENFSQNASGVAMKYKLMGLENATSKKERTFKVGLQRRIELICNMLSVMGTDYDYRAINITFTRNIPTNIIELADVISKIGHLLSKKTQIELLPLDIDYDAEVTQREKENNSGGFAFDFGDEE